MSTISNIIFPTESHNPTNTDPIERVGEKYPGDGYYNKADGLHTVQWTLDNFTGTILFQASLALDPQNDDWFTTKIGDEDQYTVDTTGLVSRANIKQLTYEIETSGSYNANIIGNYVWIRVKIQNWTTGSVEQVLLSC